MSDQALENIRRGSKSRWAAYRAAVGVRGDLNPREVEAMKHLSEGKTNKEIATAMDIAEGSAKMYLERARQKLGIRNRAALAVYFVRTFGCLILAAALHAQPTFTLATSDPVFPGAVIQITAALGGSAGKDIQAIGATLNAGSTNIAAGAASTAANKTLRSDGLNLAFLGVSAATPPVFSAAAYGDGPVFSFSYPIPSTAVIGTVFHPPSIGVSAANSAGTSIPISLAALNLTVGIAASCLGTINSNITGYLAAPTPQKLGVLVTQIVSASNTGTCQ